MSMLFAAVLCGTVDADQPVSNLKASARNGQVFLTWKEAETPEGTTFNVYLSPKPIKSVKRAKLIAHHIERHSARDWWEDPSSFRKDKEPTEPVGFIIESGGKRLNPSGGLFVDTIAEAEKGKGYYAVTATGPDGKESTALIPGKNTLKTPVTRTPGGLVPIWQHEGTQPPPGAGKNKALWLSLHAKGGVIPNSEYLLFGDESMGWRRGLPFKFSVRVSGDEVVVRPTDRVWINRPHLEAGDAGKVLAHIKDEMARLWLRDGKRADRVQGLDGGTDLRLHPRRDRIGDHHWLPGRRIELGPVPAGHLTAGIVRLAHP